MTLLSKTVSFKDDNLYFVKNILVNNLANKPRLKIPSE